MYLGFVSWVRTQALERGCERVYFLARDGWILQQVYQRLGGDPVASYLYASRRALNLPALVRLGEVELDFLSSGYTPLRVGDFLGRIGVDAIEHRAEIVAAGFGSAEERVGLDRRDRLRALFKRLEPVLLARAAAERSVAIDYLREQGVTDARKVAIVDLGWQGTLQRSLSTLLREAGAATELVGLYLGTFEHARAIAAQGLELHGWLCDFAEPARWYRAIRACVEIWEFLHAAPHGSVTGFVRGPRAVEPVLARDPAPPAQRAAADTLQRAALEYLDDALTVLHGRALAVTRETAAAPLERVVLDPTVEEATRFGELYHGEGFGDVVELRQIVPAPSWKARLGFPTRLRHEYDSAYWKQGYFARNPLARLRRDALTGRRA